MYHKSIINSYLIIMFICKFESINCSLIRKLFMPKNLESRSSKMDSRSLSTVTNTFISSPYSKSIDSLISSSVNLPVYEILPIDAPFLFSSPLPKNIPLKEAAKSKSSSSKKSPKKTLNSSKLTNSDKQMNKLKFKKHESNRPDFEANSSNLNAKYSKLTHKTKSNRSSFKPSPIQKFTKPYYNTPLPNDSPLIFNTSLIKNKPIISHIANTPLSSMNFYYLIDEDRPDYLVNDNDLLNYQQNYFNQECNRLNELNRLGISTTKSQAAIKQKDFNRNDSRGYFFNLKKPNKPNKPYKSNKKYSSSKSKKVKKPQPKKVKKNNSVSKQKQKIKTKSKSKSRPKNKTYQKKNHHSKTRLTNGKLIAIPNDLVFSYPKDVQNLLNYQSNQISYPIYTSNDVYASKKDKTSVKTSTKKTKNQVKKKNSKKPYKLANSSSNDKFVIIKHVKPNLKKPRVPPVNQPTNREYNKLIMQSTKLNLKPNKNLSNQLEPIVDKLSVSSSAPSKSAVNHVFKNAIYLNRKETKREMLDAFHQSTLEEDMNIIKEILNDYNALSKDPVVNQYYVNSDYKLVDNKNKVNDDNYIIIDHNQLNGKGYSSDYKHKGHKGGKKSNKKKPYSKNKNKDHSKGRRYPFFGFPLTNVYSNDFFDQETTYDEHMFEKYYPYRHGVNPGIRDLIKRIFYIEAKIAEWKDNGFPVAG